MEIEIPNGWEPRPYQKPLWKFLEKGGKRACYTWHRRCGKDDVGLHWTACGAFDRPGTYWYMLPQASQSRKAIWDAVNPHTGKRRIDEAFPEALRKRTRHNEMFMELKNGSTWQVVGSDNFNSLVGSPPVGCVFSEWSLSNPAAWSYLRPILAENGGWALFNFTPRGRNHAVTMFEGAQNDPIWFTQKLTAYQTGVFTVETLERERIEYIREMGEDDGDARFRQEYLCDFDAPIVGAFFAKEMATAEQEGRIGDFPYDKSVPVYTASDIGRTDDLATIFYQKHHMRIHIIDYSSESGKDVSWFAKMLQDRGYIYGGQQSHIAPHTLPWDAIPETFASPRSVIQQLTGFGIRTRIAPNLDKQDQIQALRSILGRCYFHKPKTQGLVDCLRNYQREWDDERKVFKKTPLHNWASHGADGGMYMAVSYQEDNPTSKASGYIRPPTLNEVWAQQPRSRDTRI